MYLVLDNSALMSTRQETKSWLWKGLLAPGETTLFTGLWKTGKSTLISVILSKMKDGGELAGLPVSRARVVIISEEPPAKWAERGHRVGFSDHLMWICRSFKGKPTHEEWLALIQQIADMHEQNPIDLVVIDSLANLSPMRSENDAGEMLKTVLPLQDLTKRNIAVLISHHPRKGTVLPGQAARGSGALSGYVDAIIEMHRFSTHHAKDRRRRLHAYSRHDETPPTTVLELNAEAADYLHLSGNGELDFARAWPIIHDMLENADIWQHLSCRHIHRHWPEGAVPPALRTIQQWLKQAAKDGIVERIGEGKRKDPYKYCLKGMICVWQERFNAHWVKECSKYDEKPNAPTAACSLANNPTDDSPISPNPTAPANDISQTVSEGQTQPASSAIECRPQPTQSVSEEPPTRSVSEGPSTPKSTFPPLDPFWEKDLKARRAMVDLYTRMGEEIDRKLKASTSPGPGTNSDAASPPSPPACTTAASASSKTGDDEDGDAPGDSGAAHSAPVCPEEGADKDCRRSAGPSAFPDGRCSVESGGKAHLRG